MTAMTEDEWPVLGDPVQHCNARTEYEMIMHGYQPDTCSECAGIANSYRKWLDR